MIEELADPDAALAELGDETVEALAGVPLAVGGPVTGDREAADRGPPGARIPAAFPAHREGAVEDERPQRVGMAEGVGLGEVGAVGVAVHLDVVVVAERRPDIVDVVGDRRGPVGIEARPELVGALAEADRVGGAADLHVATVDRLRVAGPTGIDEQHLAVLEQAGERRRVVLGTADRAIARAAFDRDQHATGRRLAIVTRPDREADRDLAERRIGALVREVDRPATEPGRQPRLIAARLQVVEADAVGGDRIGRCDRARGGGRVRPCRGRLVTIAATRADQADDGQRARDEGGRGNRPRAAPAFSSGRAHPRPARVARRGPGSPASRPRGARRPAARGPGSTRRPDPPARPRSRAASARPARCRARSWRSCGSRSSKVRSADPRGPPLPTWEPAPPREPAPGGRAATAAA